MKSKRIFIGFGNAAGYGVRLLKGFGEIGINADLYLFGEHPFGYTQPNIKYCKYSDNYFLRLFQKYILAFKIIFRYDGYIFITPQTLLRKYIDLKIIRLLRKRMILIFVGCDVQQPEMTNKPHIKFSACHNCGIEYKEFVGCYPENKLINTKTITKIVTHIESHYAFSDMLTSYNQIIVPINKSDFSKFEELPKTSNPIPVILHAPSNKGYKGTDFLIEAVERLKNEGYKFEFKLVQNVKIDELYKEIYKADLVVDQLIQGWYGLLPLESMMLRKPVISYIREDVLKHIPEGCPIVNANPDTVYEVLKDSLVNKDKWGVIGEKGREFVIKNHNAKDICEFYSDILFNIEIE